MVAPIYYRIETKVVSYRHRVGWRGRMVLQVCTEVEVQHPLDSLDVRSKQLIWRDANQHDPRPT